MHPRRRVGRPRLSWTEETLREIWDHIKKDDARYRFTQFEPDNEEMAKVIQEYAENNDQ